MDFLTFTPWIVVAIGIIVTGIGVLVLIEKDVLGSGGEQDD